MMQTSQQLTVREAALALHNHYLPYIDDWFQAVGAGDDCLYVYCKYEPENIMLPENFRNFPVIPKVVGDTVIGQTWT